MSKLDSKSIVRIIQDRINDLECRKDTNEEKVRELSAVIQAQREVIINLRNMLGEIEDEFVKYTESEKS